MALPPCHFGFDCYVSQPETANAKINLCVFLRSSDVILGLPANIANYAFVAHCIARAVGMGVGELVVALCGDTHIYIDTVPTAEELLQRGEQPAEDVLPQLVFHTENTVVDAYEWDKTRKDFSVKNYFPHSAIKTPLAV
jgi:thymidylate synthase